MPNIPRAAHLRAFGDVNLRSDYDGRYVCNFSDHVFDDSAGIEFGAIVGEEGEIAGEEFAKIRVAY